MSEPRQETTRDVFTVERSVDQLVAEYMRVIGPQHHKDRDCHWAIEKRWSYGELAGYYVQHDGYCYEHCGSCGEDGPFRTHEDALERMAHHLRRAIREAKEWAE
jgi:hypothetical protein